MTTDRQTQRRANSCRRYVVHLLCIHEAASDQSRYVVRVQPWPARKNAAPQMCERAFADDCELIAAINPLLPLGSDVRDVFGHIESPNGFFYLLRLTADQARELGWRA